MNISSAGIDPLNPTATADGNENVQESADYYDQSEHPQALYFNSYGYQGLESTSPNSLFFLQHDEKDI
jgi:hypothetical protein